MKYHSHKTNEGILKSPLRYLIDAILLVDDIIYQTVAKISATLESKTGCHRKDVALGFYGIGCLADSIVSSQGNFWKMLLLLAMDTCVLYLYLRFLPNSLFEPDISEDGAAPYKLRPAERFIQLLRISFLVLSVYTLLETNHLVPELIGARKGFSIFLFGCGLYAYLLSGSNGRLKKIKKAITATLEKARAKLPALAPSPKPHQAQT